MGKLLINERPLVVLPGLAVKVGLNEAIVLQQIHYWTDAKAKAGTDYHDGRYWVYNTYEDWQIQFPFWSTSTIRRVISNLEKAGYLITGNYNAAKFDATKWYAIDYELLDGDTFVQNGQTVCPSDGSLSKMAPPSAQNDPTRLFKMNRPIPESNHRVHTDIPPIPPKGDCTESPFEDFWKAYPRKVGKQAARKSWQKVKPGTALQAKIMEAVAAAKRSKEWTKDDGQFIPMPATWLNQGRWDDELTPADPGQAQQPKAKTYRVEIIDGEERVIFGD